jgi:hypothetical protein
MTRFALPMERSIEPGSRTWTRTLIPIMDFTRCKGSGIGSFDVYGQRIERPFARQLQHVVRRERRYLQNQLFDLRRK